MSKHTPGPWNLSDELTTDKHFVIDLGHNVSGCVLIERHREGFDTWDEANARLIAAAPEMLEALKTALETIQWLGGDAYEQESIAPDLDEIRQAIVKAEGRS